MTHTTDTTTTLHFYYFGFQYQNNKDLGFGGIELPVFNPITTFDGVREVQEYLRAKGYPNALVLGFSLLRTEAVPAGGAR